MSIDVVYGPPHADCEFCTLKATCREQRRFVTSAVGAKYREGGLMIVGEFPDRMDVQRGQPFSGRTGQLLDALLDAAGIDPDTTWKTLALLGRPADVSAKGLKGIEQNVYACLARLDLEIEAARPRVIVTLGQIGLDALTGTTYTKRSLVDNPCDFCSPIDRKVGPVLQCFDGDCRHIVPVPDNARTDEHAAKVWAQDWLTSVGHACPKCQTSMKRAKPKRVKCPTCGGKKKIEHHETLFESERVLTGRNGVVGAVFSAADLPGDLAKHGVKYMIPTYAPNLLLIPTRDGATAGKFLVGGQYAARPAVDHLKKAKELLTRHARFDVTVRSTEGMSFERAAQTIAAYTAEPGDFAVDIETDSRNGPWKTTNIVCIGIHRIGQEEALVVDTRLVGGGWNEGNPIIEALYRFMDSPKHGKVFHNGAYDRVVMARLWGFDLNGVIGDTMVAHNACYPDEEHGLGFCAHELTDAPAWKGGHVSNKDFDAHATLSGYRTFEELALYNARDLRATDLVWQKLQHRLIVEKTEAVNESDMIMTELGIAMELAGLPLSQTALAKVDAEQSVEAATLLEEMRRLTKKGDFLPSGDQLLWALYDPNGPCQLPVLTTTATGRPSADKDALRAHAKHPFVQALMKHKVLEYNLSHFVRSPDLAVQEDGRLHPQWKVTGARTGRWTSKPNCFSGDTELLTEHGWVRFDAVDPANAPKVAQYDVDTKRISWTAADAWVKKRAPEELLHIETTATSLLVTPEHRCLVLDRSGVPKVVPATAYPKDHRQLHAGVFAPSRGHRGAPDELVRFMVALQADAYAGRRKQDGSWPWQIRVDKLRKVGRLRQVLGAVVAYKYVKREYAHRTRHEFSFTLPPEVQQQLAPWLDIETKRWTARWLTHAPIAMRETFLRELHHWDGCHGREIGSTMYSTSDQHNADMVQAVLAVTGYRARRRAYRSKRANTRTNWQIDGQERADSWTTTHTKTASHGHEYVYCVAVPSSFIVVRHAGCVSITGQCQNWPKWMRTAFVAPQGRKLVGADQAQLEMRIVASLAGDANLIHRCITADEDDKLNPDCDPHSYVASLVFGDAFTKLDRFDPAHYKPKPGEPKCKCQKCRRSVLRDIVKRVVYGLNYGAGAQTVLAAIYSAGYDGPPLDVAFIERVVVIYFKAFPGIPTWREKTLKTALTAREVRSPLLGRHRLFPLGDAEPSVIYNYPIQAGGADVMAKGLTALHVELPKVDPSALFIAQIHDAIYVECDETKAEAVARCIERCMSFDLAFVDGAPPMKYVATATIGTNLAEV